MPTIKYVVYYHDRHTGVWPELYVYAVCDSLIDAVWHKHKSDAYDSLAISRLLNCPAAIKIELTH